MIDSRIDLNDITPEELILCEKEANLHFWSLNYRSSYEVSVIFTENNLINIES